MNLLCFACRWRFRQPFLGGGYHINVILSIILPVLSTVKSLIYGAPNPKTLMFVVSSFSWLFPICWSQVLRRKWRCSWSSADRWCSNYIWVVNNVIAYHGASYIRGFTVTIKITTVCPMSPIYLAGLAASQHRQLSNMNENQRRKFMLKPFIPNGEITKWSFSNPGFGSNKYQRQLWSISVKE